ncbi:MAG: F0F1 ATP synthase subunit epsilon [Gammaproteobacteria bacterium]|nr:F0F1 ATP synthase subunit epsilon [Gammaproteobacteria bacterium]MCY4165239.1 F0F1 ATP synthase subunit epsilon [Gammaproteobacteria bacterium]MCY4256056.1 F0F1 ATP synthase subunit epsilon [Gammaproteobacteria bacterium]MCY4340734.1 F0F1 ATP synthase subunit epsilon [Gammaproteobacteria bacterium]
MASIHVDIVSAEGAIFSGEADFVVAPASQGDVGIAPRHAPLLTELRPGPVRVQREGGDEQLFYVTGGLLEIQPSAVTVLADAALRPDQLDVDAADEARKKAEEALAGATEKSDIEKAQRDLAEASARHRALKRLRGTD